MESSLSSPGLVRRLYNFFIEMSHHPYAFWAYCCVCFAESSFFPLPPDLMMIPMVLANRAQAWILAFWGTVFSVLGGIVGYAIGYYLFQTMGIWIIEAYHLGDTFAKFQKSFDLYGFWIIVLKGLTPIPYKLVTISSGLAHFDFIQFVGASIIARAFRFYLLAGLLWFFGPWAKDFIEKYLGLLLTASLAIIVLGFFVVKFLG